MPTPLSEVPPAKLLREYEILVKTLNSRITAHKRELNALEGMKQTALEEIQRLTQS